MIRRFLSDVHREQPALSIAAWLAVAVAPLLISLALLDERLICGENPWLKPLKFVVAFAAYFWTLGWMLRHAPASPWIRRTIGGATAAMFAVEAVCLALPAAWGVRSHFNVSTPLAATMFYSMGAAAHVQVAALIWLWAIYFRPNVALSPLRLWSVRVGIALVLFGAVPGELMIAHAGHTFGAADGGPGLPLTGWSAVAGDLRVAHFLGVHAMQVLPLAAFALERWGRTLTALRRQAWWCGFSAAYAALLLAAALQALGGLALWQV